MSQVECWEDSDISPSELASRSSLASRSRQISSSHVAVIEFHAYTSNSLEQRVVGEGVFELLDSTLRPFDTIAIWNVYETGSNGFLPFNDDTMIVYGSHVHSFDDINLLFPREWDPIIAKPLTDALSHSPELREAFNLRTIHCPIYYMCDRGSVFWHSRWGREYLCYKDMLGFAHLISTDTYLSEVLELAGDKNGEHKH